MSLYDKYYSQHNKTYMYDLIASIIKKDNSVDVSQHVEYNTFFEKNFINTFKSVNTEELSELNKHLLQTQIDYYENFMNHKLKQSTDKEQVKIDDQQENILIHSLQRNINLQNSTRFNYRIKNPVKQINIQLEKVLLPIEDTHLFMCPTMILCLDTTYIELHLRGTFTLRQREYGIYTPYYESTFQLNSDILRIQFKNQLYNLDSGCDVYKIDSCESNHLTIQDDDCEFKQDDYIRICNFDKLSLDNDTFLQKVYKIKSLTYQDSKIHIQLDKDIQCIPGLYIMNMSLQHSIHLSILQ